MAVTKFPNGIASMGMPVYGGGGFMTTGTVKFVDSTTGSNGNSGDDKDHPYATIDYAVGQCTASKGDVIFVMPGHAESVTAAAGLDLDIEGISVIGLGNGDDRPTITLSSATTADIDVDADNITVQNVRIDLTGVDAVAAGIDVNKAHFTLKDCDIILSDTGGQAVTAMTLDGNASYCTVDNCRFYDSTDGQSGPSHAITMSAATVDFFTLVDSYFHGKFSVACLNATVAGCGWNIQRNCFYNVADTGAMPIELGTTGATNFGICAYNLISAGTSTESGALVDGAHWGDLQCFENYVAQQTDDTSGRLAPVVESC